MNAWNAVKDGNQTSILAIVKRCCGSVCTVSCLFCAHEMRNLSVMGSLMLPVKTTCWQLSRAKTFSSGRLAGRARLERGPPDPARPGPAARCTFPLPPLLSSLAHPEFRVLRHGFKPPDWVERPSKPIPRVAASLIAYEAPGDILEQIQKINKKLQYLNRV